MFWKSPQYAAQAKVIVNLSCLALQAIKKVETLKMIYDIPSVRDKLLSSYLFRKPQDTACCSTSKPEASNEHTRGHNDELWMEDAQKPSAIGPPT
jgi:hypothetical protein